MLLLCEIVTLKATSRSPNTHVNISPSKCSIHVRLIDIKYKQYFITTYSVILKSKPMIF